MTVACDSRHICQTHALFMFPDDKFGHGTLHDFQVGA